MSNVEIEIRKLLEEDLVAIRGNVESLQAISLENAEKIEACTVEIEEIKTKLTEIASVLASQTPSEPTDTSPPDDYETPNEPDENPVVNNYSYTTTSADLNKWQAQFMPNHPYKLSDDIILKNVIGQAGLFPIDVRTNRNIRSANDSLGRQDVYHWFRAPWDGHVTDMRIEIGLQPNGYSKGDGGVTEGVLLDEDGDVYARIRIAPKEQGIVLPSGGANSFFTPEIVSEKPLTKGVKYHWLYEGLEAENWISDQSGTLHADNRHLHWAVERRDYVSGFDKGKGPFVYDNEFATLVPIMSMKIGAKWFGFGGYGPGNWNTLSARADYPFVFDSNSTENSWKTVIRVTRSGMLRGGVSALLCVSPTGKINWELRKGGKSLSILGEIKEDKGSESYVVQRAPGQVYHMKHQYPYWFNKEGIPVIKDEELELIFTAVEGVWVAIAQTDGRSYGLNGWQNKALTALHYSQKAGKYIGAVSYDHDRDSEIAAWYGQFLYID